MPAATRHVRLQSQNRFDPRLARGAVEMDHAKHVSVVGESYRRHAQFFGAIDEVGYLHGSVEKTVIGVSMEMYEIAGHCYSSPCWCDRWTSIVVSSFDLLPILS